MKAKSAKAKGTKLEVWVRNAFQSIGLRSHRQPGSGIYADWPHDVAVEIHGDSWIVECKARKDPPKVLENWLSGAHILVLKADRAEPRVYMRWEMFARLISKELHVGELE